MRASYTILGFILGIWVVAMLQSCEAVRAVARGAHDVARAMCEVYTGNPDNDLYGLPPEAFCNKYTDAFLEQALAGQQAMGAKLAPTAAPSEAGSESGSAEPSPEKEAVAPEPAPSAAPDP